MANVILSQKAIFLNGSLFKAINRIGVEAACDVYDQLIFELKENGFVSSQEHSYLASSEMSFLPELISQELAAAVFESASIVLRELANS